MLAVALLCSTPLAAPARAADDSRVDRLLRAVDVVASEPYHPGYDRDCDPGACVAKEASSPSEWLPPRRRYRCTYVRRYLRVAVAWDLPITSADESTIRTLGC